MFETVNSFFFFLRYAETGTDYFTSGTFQYKNQIKYQGNIYASFLHSFHSLALSLTYVYYIF